MAENEEKPPRVTQKEIYAAIDDLKADMHDIKTEIAVIKNSLPSDFNKIDKDMMSLRNEISKKHDDYEVRLRSLEKTKYQSGWINTLVQAAVTSGILLVISQILIANLGGK
jgi:peptidoglycan hydrolase CwlO-like protein